MSTPKKLRPGGRPRLGHLVALLTATAVAASLLSTPSNPAQAATTLPGVPAGLVPADAEPVAVTLITGDTVFWQDSGDGNPRVVEIDEAPRAHPVTFDQSGTQEDFYVIPTDAMEHVVAGTVDEELFNVPGLIRQGLDDAATDELPVIVTFDQGWSTPQLARDADVLPATNDVTVVEKVNGAGVKVDRGKAGTFWRAVFSKPGPDGSARTAGVQELDGAVEKVMLDRMLEIDLAESVPQIGAPQAWDSGYTGEGVTVAVLDTGIDASHPDLVGQVVAVENFTDEPDAIDAHGHGTHVASTIAGTGAASDGARTGVAPGADLLIGKVCTADGRCQTSSIMAGMEWAIAQGAGIVNLSLGGDPTDGTDALSELLNRLSAESGALFVSSAGNFGCCLGLVGSPAAADAALAVGAVDKSDQLAWFSSRGPRVGDHAVKPEITAPGMAIVAARAAGTGMGSPVDEAYTSADGTSMASPHVAGAAALLAQASPDLSGAQLKDALVSAAADGGYRWNEQGTGRADITAALDSPIYAQGTVNLGGVDGHAQEGLVYTNRSDDDITLSLDVAVTDSTGEPVAGVTLSENSLTVPANAQASVTITVTADDVIGQGPFGGVVTATGPDNVALRSGIGFGPPLHRVTIEVLDSNGDRIGTDTAPDRPVTLVSDTFDHQNPVGSPDYRVGTSDGIATANVPAGIYTIITAVNEIVPDTRQFTRNSVLTEVEVDIDTGTSLTLDARDTVPIQVTLPRRADKRNHEVALIREYANPPPGQAGQTFTLHSGGESYPVYAKPTPPGDLAFLALWVHWTLAEPKPVHPLFGDTRCPRLPFWCYSETPAYVYNLPFLYENGIPSDLHERVLRRDLVEVPSWYHSDQPDALITHQFSVTPPLSCLCGGGVTQRMLIEPGHVTEYMLTDDRLTWNRQASLTYRPGGVRPTRTHAQLSSDRFLEAEAGARRAEEHWFQSPVQVGAPDIREEHTDNPRGRVRPAAAARGGSDGNQFVPGYLVMDNTRGHLVTSTGFASWRMWNLDTGTELQPDFPLPDASLPVFSLATQEASYRLEQTGDYPANMAPLFRTGPATTTWTFSSRSSDAGVPAGYECVIQHAPREDVCQIQPLIQLEYDLGLDVNNRSSAGRAHVFTITAGHHSKAIDHAPVMSLTVQASFDDGGTWHDARLVNRPRDTSETGGFLPSTQPYQEFLVVLRHPRLADTDGYVTLRVRAVDARGGTIDQLVYRAYSLK